MLSKQSRSIARSSAEYQRIRDLLEVLTDGETYMWEELARFFDVVMDDRGKAMFRRAVLAEKRLYSPLAFPARGLGIVMGEAKTVADIVGDKQKRVMNATVRVIDTIDIAQLYKGVPSNDRNYMRALKAQNQAILNANRTKPLRRIRGDLKIATGVDWSPDMLGVPD